jgi:hypothetical protein
MQTVRKKGSTETAAARKKGSADRSSQTREPASWGAITAKKGLKSKIESGLPPDCGMVDEQTAAPAHSLMATMLVPELCGLPDDCHHPKRRMSVGFKAPTMHTHTTYPNILTSNTAIATVQRTNQVRSAAESRRRGSGNLQLLGWKP